MVDLLIHNSKPISNNHDLIDWKDFDYKIKIKRMYS